MISSMPAKPSKFSSIGNVTSFSISIDEAPLSFAVMLTILNFMVGMRSRLMLRKDNPPTRITKAEMRLTRKDLSIKNRINFLILKY